MNTANTVKTSARRPAGSSGAVLRIAALVVLALAVTLFISYAVFGGGSLSDVLTAMQAIPDYQNLILVNLMIGASVALFVEQMRWNALRVTLTVVIALVLGFFVTFFFNTGYANRFAKGEFRAALISTAQPSDNDKMDLKYGAARGGEFNKDASKTPLKSVAYHFEGHKGDVVTVLAYASGSRSEVDLQVALADDKDSQLAFATTSTPDQIAKFSGKLRTASDAIIQDFALPADGVYTIKVAPEPIAIGTVLREALQNTNVAYRAFLLGALGRPNRWAIWMQDALTLILLGLAIAIVFRARQFCLGAEGQIYMGALVSGAIALAWGNSSPWIVIPAALLGAGAVGFLWGLIPGALKAFLGANELVSSLMLNTIGTRFFELVLNSQLKPPEAGGMSSKPFEIGGQLPPIIANTQVTVAVFLVIVAVIAVWLLINRTIIGYEIRMVGSNRKFADYGGINTRRTIMLSMAVSGIVAGLAGAHLSMGIYRQLLVNMSSGLAFEGVVVALLARNNPLVIPFTGLLYAYLRAGAQFMERDSNVSFEVVRIIQAVIILLITAEALIVYIQNYRMQHKPTPPSEAKNQPVTLEAPAA